MAKCWTCGASISGVSYTCPSCKSLSEFKNLQEQLEFYQADISESINYMAEIQKDGFTALADTFSTGLSEIASAIEWGFDDIGWKLQQQTDVLLSIDSTLKNPSQIQANELRQMAEELRYRGTLSEAEEFYLKALELNPLDYRIYVGLARTYLQSNKFNKAKEFLEKSLPHAPKKKNIDYKSYSYRLIGHIYECKEDYSNAMTSLHTSIELSPDYVDGQYDYAQYCAQMRNKETCLSSLEKAILVKSLYWYLAQKERNFNHFRSKVEELIMRIKTDAHCRSEDVITKAENILKEVKESFETRMEEAWESILIAIEALNKSREKKKLRSNEEYNNAKTQYQNRYENTKSTLESAKNKVASGDYAAFLEAKSIAEKSIILSIKFRDEMKEIVETVISMAKEEHECYKKIRKEKVISAWSMVPGAFGLSFLSCTIGFFGGCVVGLFSGSTNEGAGYGSSLGLIAGIILGIYNINKELS